MALPLVALIFQTPPVHTIKWSSTKSDSEAIRFTEPSLRLESDMSLAVKKTRDGLYEATATPPHVKASWSTTEPIVAKRLIEELKSRGCHQQDIGDALYEQDPKWVEKL